MDAQGGEEDEGREGGAVGSKGPGQDSTDEEGTHIPLVGGNDCNILNFF